MSEAEEIEQAAGRVIDKLEAEIDHLRAELGRMRKLGDEFVWGENNPQEYESEMTQLKARLHELGTRVTDVSDNLLGIQEVAQPIELLDRIESHGLQLRREIAVAEEDLRESTNETIEANTEKEEMQHARDCQYDDMVVYRDQLEAKTAQAEAAYAEIDRQIVEWKRDQDELEEWKRVATLLHERAIHQHHCATREDRDCDCVISLKAARDFDNATE